jgi:hypothetical protein
MGDIEGGLESTSISFSHDASLSLNEIKNCKIPLIPNSSWDQPKTKTRNQIHHRKDSFTVPFPPYTSSSHQSLFIHPQRRHIQDSNRSTFKLQKDSYVIFYIPFLPLRQSLIAPCPALPPTNIPHPHPHPPDPLLQRQIHTSFFHAKIGWYTAVDLPTRSRPLKTKIGNEKELKRQHPFLSILIKSLQTELQNFLLPSFLSPAMPKGL